MFAESKKSKDNRGNGNEVHCLKQGGIMKKHFLFIAIILSIFLLFICACAPCPLGTSGKAEEEKSEVVFKLVFPVAVEGKKDLFQADRFYFAGQPDEETFRWLAGEGVELVVNIRTDEEMETLAKEEFDEPALLKELGMTYVHIPIGGEIGYSPQSVEALADALAHLEGKNGGKALIHCKMAGRVSYLWAAYLVNCKGYSIDDAIEYAKKIKFRNYLEDLLGYPITCLKKAE